MNKRISTDKYELIGIRRIRLATGRYAQIATRRVAFAPDRLYAWQGRHTAPTWEQEQDSHETNREFIESITE